MENIDARGENFPPPAEASGKFAVGTPVRIKNVCYFHVNRAKSAVTTTTKTTTTPTIDLFLIKTSIKANKLKIATQIAS